MTRPVPADESGLARTRERFLTAEPIEGENVRGPILASWMRSQRGAVPADHIELPYRAEQNLDTPLIRAAEPVLARLGEQLEGQSVSLILTDPRGVVLTQRTGDPDLHRHLQRVELAPGFSYGEQFVGTNGIGTALEDGRPTHVFGHEHYAENLENLACAGVPIHDPISGKTVGAVDLTCWRKDAGQLLVALARTTAEQIRQALLGNSDVRELALFQAYLRACRRTTGILLAFNDEVVMMNDRARRLLDPADQSVLLGHATQALADGRASTTVVLPTGSKVRMNCREVPGPRGGPVGSVVRVRLIESDDDGTAPMAKLPMFLPGVVGSAPLWLRSCHEVDAAYGRGEWLALAGERGVGKSTLARCVHQRRNPVGRVHVVDVELGPEWCARIRAELIEDPVDSLVLRHADRLDQETMLGLVEVLDEARLRDRPLWVAITLDGSDRDDLGELLGHFPRTVHIPPLRRHVEDLSELVPFLLSKLSRGGQLTCSPAAMHLLMRAAWPRNVPQLHQVLKYVAQRKRSGVIQPADLPAEYRAVARRPLNRLESMERDAIVHSLEDTDGNKNRAAQLLGMSRATLYRKIHEYGIVTPAR